MKKKIIVISCMLLATSHLQAGKKKQRKNTTTMSLFTFQKHILLADAHNLEQSTLPLPATYESLNEIYTDLLAHARTSHELNQLHKKITLNYERLQLAHNLKQQQIENNSTLLKKLIYLKTQKENLIKLRNTYQQTSSHHMQLHESIKKLEKEYTQASFDYQCTRLKERAHYSLKTGIDKDSYIRLCNSAKQLLKNENQRDKAFASISEISQLAFKANRAYLASLMAKHLQPKYKNKRPTYNRADSEAIALHAKRIHTQTVLDQELTQLSEKINNIDSCQKAIEKAIALRDSYPSFHPEYMRYNDIASQYEMHNAYLHYDIKFLTKAKELHKNAQNKNLTYYASRLIDRIYAEQHIDFLYRRHTVPYTEQREAFINLRKTYEPTENTYARLTTKIKRLDLKHKHRWIKTHCNRCPLEQYEALHKNISALLNTYNPQSSKFLRLQTELEVLAKQIEREKCLACIKINEQLPLNKITAFGLAVMYNKLWETALFLQEYCKTPNSMNTEYEQQTEIMITFYQNHVTKFGLIKQLEEQIAAQTKSYGTICNILQRLIALPVLTQDEKERYDNEHECYDILRKKDLYTKQLAVLEGATHINPQACIEILNKLCELNAHTIQEDILLNKKLDRYYQQIDQ